jgi:hypothetical protein
MTPVEMDDNPAENRVPFKLINTGATLQCKWTNTRSKRFTEPFFDETYAKLRVLDPKNRSQPYISDLDEMHHQGQVLDAVTPAVIIFHVSRCGSTLVSQLFASSGRFIVLSEVPFFDKILSLPFSAANVEEAKIPGYFSSALNFYGRKRDTEEEHVVMKTDCWHIFFYKELRNLFPSTPFVLMYRSPDEVLHSNLKKPGWQTIPELVDPRIFGLPGMPEHYQRDIYTATIIEKMLAKYLEVAQTDGNSLLVNYSEGAMPILKKIAAFAKLEFDDNELAVMEDRSRYHSKDPEELFNKEPVADAPEYLSGAMRLYGFLEEKRIANG